MPGTILSDREKPVNKTDKNPNLMQLLLVGGDRQRSQITDNAGGDKTVGNQAGYVTILTRTALLCKGSRDLSGWRGGL